MKLNSMKPAKISICARAAFMADGQGRDGKAGGAADEADDLQPDAADPVRQQHGGDDADDQQEVDERRAFGRDQDRCG